ncbi:MAG TPA: hypothetical protein VFH78_15775 [Candidatus Thermoplasmatota archaeon]|nr:hypothetical protein [Candidatus Thermoplasmatota archaeon]
MPRESWFGKLNRHFHTHPQGRLHEILFWSGMGVVLGAVSFFGWRTGHVSTPFALMLAVVSVCLIGWGLLPRAKTRAPPPLPKGKRGEIAKKVRASKAEKKNKGGGPPPPPIRRG